MTQTLDLGKMGVMPMGFAEMQDVNGGSWMSFLVELLGHAAVEILLHNSDHFAELKARERQYDLSRPH